MATGKLLITFHFEESLKESLMNSSAEYVCFMILLLSIVTFIYLSTEPVRKFTMSFTKYIFLINNLVTPQSWLLLLFSFPLLCLIIKALDSFIFF